MKKSGETRAVKRTGAQFNLGKCTPEDLALFSRVLFTKPKQLSLVQAIFDLCLEAPDRATDSPTLIERLGIDRATIRQRLAPLLEQGLIKTELRQVYAKARSVNVYELVRPSALPSPSVIDPGNSLTVPLPSAADSEQACFAFMGRELPGVTQLSYHPELNQRMTIKGWRSAVFMIIAGLRVGNTGKDVASKQTRIYIGKQWFDLEVRAVEGSQIPSILDLRILIVLCSLVKDHLDHAKERGEPEKGFILTMTAICEAMGMEPLAGNKRYLFRQLSSWKSSLFEVKQAMYGVLDTFPLFNLKRSFNMLGDVVVLETLSKDGTVPEIIHVMLNPALLIELEDFNQTLSVHREILLERKPSPFMHLVYYWCRRVVQHSTAPRIFQLEHLRRELRLDSDISRFRAEFTKLVKERQCLPTHQPLAAIPGYFIAYNRAAVTDEQEGAEEVSIHANPDDPIISHRAKLLTAEKRGRQFSADVLPAMLQHVTSGSRRPK